MTEEEYAKFREDVIRILDSVEPGAVKNVAKGTVLLFMRVHSDHERSTFGHTAVASDSPGFHKVSP